MSKSKLAPPQWARTKPLLAPEAPTFKTPLVLLALCIFVFVFRPRSFDDEFPVTFGVRGGGGKNKNKNGSNS